jgi:L-ascorbate metabolism protein UlaG (beta-lactamase superfamily)
VARVEFWGGVGVIGSSKVLIHDGGHRVLLDLGLDIPAGSDLFRSPAALPRGRELSARLRVGAAPAIPGLYDPAGLDPADPLGEPAGPAAVFISHPHIDHVGLAGFRRADIPAYAAPDGIALPCALDHGGETLPGPRDFSAAATSWRRADPGHPVQVGPIRVERFDVDHDEPGASGYRVTTSDGVLAFTGDLRFHGRHPERWAFADAVAGCDALVTEGTTLSFDERHPVRTEADVARDYAAALDSVPDLMLQAVYPRDLDRVRPSPPSRPRPGGRSCGRAGSRPSWKRPGPGRLSPWTRPAGPPCARPPAASSSSWTPLTSPPSPAGPSATAPEPAASHPCGRPRPRMAGGGGSDAPPPFRLFARNRDPMGRPGRYPWCQRSARWTGAGRLCGGGARPAQRAGPAAARAAASARIAATAVTSSRNRGSVIAPSGPIPSRATGSWRQAGSMTRAPT